MEKTIDIGQYVAVAVKWLTDNLRPFFDFIKVTGNTGIESLEWVFVQTQFYIIIALFSFFAWKQAGKSIAVFTLLGLTLILLMGFWEETVQSLMLILLSMFF